MSDTGLSDFEKDGAMPRWNREWKNVERERNARKRMPEGEE